MKRVILQNRHGDEIEAGVFCDHYFIGDDSKISPEVLRELGWHIKEPRKPKNYHLRCVEGEKLWAFLNLPSEVRGKFFTVDVKELIKDGE